MKRFRKRIRTGLAVFWLAVILWLFVNMQARGLSDDLLQSRATVAVSMTKTSIEFRPVVDYIWRWTDILPRGTR